MNYEKEYKITIKIKSDYPRTQIKQQIERWVGYDILDMELEEV